MGIIIALSLTTEVEELKILVETSQLTCFFYLLFHYFYFSKSDGRPIVNIFLLNKIHGSI